MPIREKGRRSPGSCPSRPFSRPQPPRRPPPKCGAFRLQPRGSPLRQTGRWSEVDSNSRSHVLSKRDTGTISCALGRWCDRWRRAPFRVRSVHGGTGSSNPLCSSGESHKLDHRDRTASHSKTAARSMRSTARSPPRGRSGRPSRRPQFEQGLVERSVLFWRLSLGRAMGIAVDRDSTIV